MPRKPFVGGNWKCNGTVESAAKLIAGLNAATVPKDVDVCVSPTSLHLDSVKGALKKDYLVASQNCSRTGKGAFTGEISAEMLKDFGINWAILGHSERRALYGESDKVIGEKVAIALKAGLNLIPCIGETLKERESGVMVDVLTRQLKSIADNVSDWSRVVIAYEPVWAIGTGVTASPEQAQEVHDMLRKWLATNYGKNVADNVRIIYGGSVKPNNSAKLMTKKDIDGFLVGGASLKAEDFSKIVSSASSLRSKL